MLLTRSATIMTVPPHQLALVGGVADTQEGDTGMTNLPSPAQLQLFDVDNPPLIDDVPYGYCRCRCGQKTRLAPQTRAALGWIKDQPIKFINGHTTRHPDARRFWQKVDRGDGNGCWLWRGGANPGTYGAGSLEGRHMGAHRIAWILAHGEIPDGLFVCHHCDTPRCVNPSHLFLGTSKQNMVDCANKGRTLRGDRHYARREAFRLARGEAHGSAKLTEQDVRQIRALYMPRVLGYQALATRYGVGVTAIWAIVTRRTWTHVP
jgi:hypothetical protein